MVKRRRVYKVTNWKFKFKKILKARKKLKHHHITILSIKSLLANSFYRIKQLGALNNFYAKSLFRFKKSSYSSLAKNFCVGTVRTRSHYRLINGTRMWIRTMADYGYLPGIRRASW
jgi:ribosomal protein S14